LIRLLRRTRAWAAGAGWAGTSWWQIARRSWELRRTLATYDAVYVALAEALGCTLVTADARLSRAPGVGCTVEVLRPR
jgi:predicted nucleic acid-binding protein